MQHDYLARRELLGVVSLAALLSKSVFADDERSGDMIYRKLGRTGERVSAIGMAATTSAFPRTSRSRAADPFRRSTAASRSWITAGITWTASAKVWMGRLCATATARRYS
jgi:hypothetical protein